MYLTLICVARVLSSRGVKGGAYGFPRLVLRRVAQRRPVEDVDVPDLLLTTSRMGIPSAGTSETHRAHLRARTPGMPLLH